MNNIRVCVIGLGYIGLPTAALLAKKGYEVIGVDISPIAVETINKGKIHIVEPDLEAFVQSAVASGRLKAYPKPSEADIFMICVPTPFKESSTGIPEPDLSYVFAATETIAGHVRGGNMVILESTSPVGTTAEMCKILARRGVSVADIQVAYCPERVLPGKIMSELIQNDRIVGGVTEESARRVGEFYKTFVTGSVFQTDSKTAELCKLVENSFRDVNIAFANELSMLCDRLDINVTELIRLANRHPRVNILQPGCGVGGHCIAVDPWFIVAQDPENARLIRTGREVNDRKSEWVTEKIRTAAREYQRANGRSPTIACMGLAFKANIDDLRESPALAIVESLLEEKLNVLAVEPNLQSHPKIKLTPWRDAIRQADLVVWLVKHKEFVAEQASGKVALDFCGVFDRGAQ